MMTSESRHPEDLTLHARPRSAAHLDDAARVHVEHCPECRDEVEGIRGLDALFHSPELFIDVPSGQWEAIAARIAAERPSRFWSERLRTLAAPDWLPSIWRPAYTGALAAALLVVVTLGGLVYERHREDQRILAALASPRPELAAGNPFDAYLERNGGENPFEKLEPSGDANPFSPGGRR